jgi:hypothetical protein
MFDTEQKSSIYLPEIITLLSSVNIKGSDRIFIVGGRSFVYIMKNEGPRTDPWETPYFTVPQFQKKL